MVALSGTLPGSGGLWLLLTGEDPLQPGGVPHLPAGPRRDAARDEGGRGGPQEARLHLPQQENGLSLCAAPSQLRRESKEERQTQPQTSSFVVCGHRWTYRNRRAAAQ